MSRIRRLLQGRSTGRSLRFTWPVALTLAIAVVATAAFAIKAPASAPLVEVTGDLGQAMQSLCATIERTASRPDIVGKYEPADLATVVLGTVGEETPGFDAFVAEVSKAPPAQRFDTFKRSVSRAIGHEWRCAKFDELWNLQ